MRIVGREEKQVMHGFSSYFWFAFKLWCVYTIAGSMWQSIVQGMVVFHLGIDTSIGATLVAGWWFWKAKFREQIREEKGLPADYELAEKNVERDKQPRTIEVEHEKVEEDQA